MSAGSKRLISAPAGAVSILSLFIGVVIGTNFAGAREPPAVTPLLSTHETVVGEPIAYPLSVPAKVTAAIVAIHPDGETGWHTHGVPVFGYILEGEITVDYGPRGAKVFRAGDSLMEAMSRPHNGRNTGAGLARILAVFMGADGVPNTTSTP